MRLYTMTGATQVSAGGTVYAGDENGVFEFPQDVGAALHSFHVDGKPAWEDDAERAARITAEQMEIVRDPATTLAELQKMTALLATALGASAATPAASETPAPEAPSDPAPSSVAKSPRSRKAAVPSPADAPSA